MRKNNNQRNPSGKYGLICPCFLRRFILDLQTTAMSEAMTDVEALKPALKGAKVALKRAKGRVERQQVCQMAWRIIVQRKRIRLQDGPWGPKRGDRPTSLGRIQGFDGSRQLPSLGPAETFKDSARPSLGAEVALRDGRGHTKRTSGRQSRCQAGWKTPADPFRSHIPDGPACPSTAQRLSGSQGRESLFLLLINNKLRAHAPNFQRFRGCAAPGSNLQMQVHTSRASQATDLQKHLDKRIEVNKSYKLRHPKGCLPSFGTAKKNDRFSQAARTRGTGGLRSPEAGGSFPIEQISQCVAWLVWPGGKDRNEEERFYQ